MIKPGEEWGRPTDANADVECHGDDQALAALIAANGTGQALGQDHVAPGEGSPGRLVRFFPAGSDLAGAVGLADVNANVGPSNRRTAEGRVHDDRPVQGIELPIDAISSDLGVAMNCVILGVIPTRVRPYHRRRPIRVRVDGRELFTGRATTVVIANGQFLEGADLVPRGHPGDGRLEIQVYALAPGERGPMRRRLPTGSHLPHPHIVATSGRVVEVDGLTRTWPITLDRRSGTVETGIRVAVLPSAIRLLI